MEPINYHATGNHKHRGPICIYMNIYIYVYIIYIEDRYKQNSEKYACDSFQNERNMIQVTVFLLIINQTTSVWLIIKGKTVTTIIFSI